MKLTENAQGALSYCTAGCGAAIASLLEAMSGYAQSITIILACAAVAVRLAYDFVRLIRYINREEERDDK